MSLRGADITEAFPHFKPECSVLKLLFEALRRNGNQVAQVEDHSGKSESFSGILKMSSSIAAGLQTSGVTVGDLVVVCCDKSILAFSLQLGIMFTGATAVLVNTKSACEIHEYVRGQKVKAVFYDPNQLESVTNSVNQIIPAPSLIATTSFEDPVIMTLLKSSQTFMMYEVKDVKKHVPLILFTSGSTTKPKGVQISDLGLQRMGYSFDEQVERFLVITPFAWISCTVFFVSSILQHYTLILSNSKEPKVHLEDIQKYKVTAWMMNSTTVSLYMREPYLLQVDLTSLTLVIGGGEVLLKRITEKFISEVLKGRIGIQSVYGMTEVGVLTTWKNRNLLDLSKANSTGYLAPGVEVKIVDDGGNTVGIGDVGEIWVKSIANMVGYWGRPDLSDQLFDKDDFFQTGDAGYFDEDGFLYITGRYCDHVDYNGTKISVTDIEDVLRSHPDILEAAVTAKPHPTDSNQLAAFVVKHPGSNTSEEEILRFVNEQVEEGKSLKGGIYFTEQLPKTSSLKIQRGLLKEMFL